MNSAPTGNRNRWRAAAVAWLGAVSLAGCEENGGFNLFAPKAETQESAAAGTAEAATAERDVEAPEVFSVTDNGLWDGRPSLGGIWVAHPDVQEPERVIIRNTANSRSVVGALFRRERENPGPALQVSSDAAEALGMLAGSPAKLSVVALRREAAPVPSTEPAEGAATENLGAPEDIEETSLDPVAGAAAAIDAAETADPAANTGASASAAEPAAQESTRPPAEPARRTAGLEKPFIQVGIFTLEENARSAATAMRRSGMLPTVRKQENDDETFWRVLVGPSNSNAEQKVLLNKIKKAGFDDAYIVTH